MKNFSGVFIFSAMLCYTVSKAQTDTTDIYDYNFEQLSKITVTTASKTPQTITEIPSTIYVITATDIKERAYFTLEDVLADLPGFQFRNIQGINSYSFMRGIPNQNNLILLLVDGIQINELNSGGFYGGAQYNLSNIERIEIVYGPASVIYGTNAVSGVINLITRKADENHLQLNAQAGTFNTIHNNFTITRTNENKNIGVLLSGMYKYTEKADLKSIKGDNNWTDLMDNYERDYNINNKILINDFIIGTDYIQKQTPTTTLIKSTGTTYKDFGTLWNIRFINNYIKYKKQITEKFLLTSALYNRNATVLPNSVYYVLDSAQIGYYRPNNLTGFECVLNYKPISKLTIISGIDVEYERLSEKNSSSFSDISAVKPPHPPKPLIEENNLISVFVQPTYILFNKIFLSGGARYDKSSFYKQVLTPNLGANYLFKKHLLRLSYAEAFRAPKPWDYTDGIGNTALEPEKMKSLEAALSVYLEKKNKLDITAYKNMLENAINKQTIGDTYRWINEGEINTNGVEVYWISCFKKFKTSFNYTYNYSVNEAGNAIPEISKHTAGTSITYNIYNQWVLNFGAYYLGKRDNPKIIQTTNNTNIAPALIFNGALTLMNYHDFNMQLSVRNILNTEYYHPSNRMPDRYRQAQRMFLVSVGYLINK